MKGVEDVLNNIVDVVVVRCDVVDDAVLLHVHPMADLVDLPPVYKKTVYELEA